MRNWNQKVSEKKQNKAGSKVSAQEYVLNILVARGELIPKTMWEI